MAKRDYWRHPAMPNAVDEDGNYLCLDEEVPGMMRELRRFLPMWVVLNDRTEDFPGKFVARLHLGRTGKPTRYVMVRDTLEEIEDFLEEIGLARIGRDERDCPHIIATYF